MAAWLDVVSDTTGWYLVDTGRLNQVVQSMGRPAGQYPSVLYFAGNASRIQALQSLFPRNNIPRRGPAGLIRLHLSSTTANSEYPVLFMESSLLSHPELSGSGRSSSDSLRRYPIGLNNAVPCTDLQLQVMTQLLLPWTHVLCLFVDTQSELQAAHRLLDAPHSMVTVGHHVNDVDSMRVVLVLSRPARASRSKDTQTTSDLQLPRDPRITILDLRDRGKLSPKAAFEPLRQLLLDGIQATRSERLREGWQFSACHLNVLWNQAIQQGIRRSTTRTDSLRVARERNPVPEALSVYLAEFLQQASKAKWEENAIHMFIASALLMDAYPPGMHYFSPRPVFDSLYRHHCRAAWEAVQGSDPEYHCDRVMGMFTQHFHSLGPFKSSSVVRQEKFIEAHLQQPVGLTDTAVCLFCLCRPSEHVLPCGHMICDTCVMIFGTSARAAGQQVELFRCSMCQQPFHLTVCQLPPTKRPVILTLDGGGIRGIITLGLLQALEKRLGGKIPVSQIPQLTVASSAGALNAMELQLNGTSVEDGFQKYPQLAQKIFSHQKTPASWVSRGLAFLSGFLSDSRYDSKTMDEIMNDIYGTQRRLFDVPAVPLAGFRVAITTSRISDGTVYLFGNYHGINRQTEDSAYQFLIPQKSNQNPFLWELARCSTAAPWFFSTKHLPGLGPMQDGGVRANNPLSIGMREQAMVWPSAGQPDLLISVGTGFVPSVGQQEDKPSGGILRDGAIPRLLRAMISSPSMDGHQAYLEALSLLPAHMKNLIVRLDHTFLQAVPRLDAVDRLPELMELEYTVPDDLVRAVLPTLFYFEIDVLPTEQQGRYHCQGSILCAWPRAGDLVERVLIEFPGAKFETDYGLFLGRVDDQDGCCTCGYYRKKIQFELRSLNETFSLILAGTSFHRQVAGFPNPVQWFLDRQQVQASFGRADHQTDTWPPARGCYCSHGHKRRVRFSEPAPEYKKPRL